MLHETFSTYDEALEFYNTNKEAVDGDNYLYIKAATNGCAPYVVAECPIKRIEAIRINELRPTTGVISDNLDNIMNPADGRIYDSKSAYYKSLKERGLEIDDRKHVEFKPPPSRFDERKFDAAFKKTLEQLNV